MFDMVDVLFETVTIMTASILQTCFIELEVDCACIARRALAHLCEHACLHQDFQHTVVVQPLHKVS